MNHRLFTAIPFPLDLYPKIQHLGSSISSKLDWDKPQRLHLTLNFLGNVTDGQLPLLQQKISSSAKTHSPFTVHFGFLQTLYNRHEGSLLYLTPNEESQDLFELQADLKDAVYHLGVPVADRYWPHMTVAHVPKSDPVTIKALLDKVDALNLKVRFTLPVESVVLFESKSDRSGTHYSRIATYPLSNGI